MKHNRRFTSVLAMPERTEKEKIIKYEDMSRLSHDFVKTCTSLGTTIISEYWLDNRLKTVKEATEKLGGKAGGKKFVAAGILFKLAIDSHGIYYLFIVGQYSIA